MLLFLKLEAGSNFGRLGLNSKSSSSSQAQKFGACSTSRECSWMTRSEQKILKCKKNGEIKNKKMWEQLIGQFIMKQFESRIETLCRRCSTHCATNGAFWFFLNLLRNKQMALIRKTILKHSFTVRPRFSIEISAWPVTAAAQAHKWCVLWSS